MRDPRINFTLDQVKTPTSKADDFAYYILRNSSPLPRNDIHVFFYKKLGSAPSTKSFLISHENFAIIVLKVS